MYVANVVASHLKAILIFSGNCYARLDPNDMFLYFQFNSFPLGYKKYSITL